MKSHLCNKACTPCAINMRASVVKQRVAVVKRLYRVAQVEEYLTVNQGVMGANPISVAILHMDEQAMYRKEDSQTPKCG